jgi:peptidoglycan/LPS O-acetylase OafA/YrhL
VSTSELKDQRPNMIPQLDGLRAFAALLVVGSHTGQIGLPFIFPSLTGGFGVLLFFMLSGFLMGYLYLHKPLDAPSVAHYIAARVARIAPIYLLVVTSAYIASLILGPQFIHYIDEKAFIRLLTFSGSSHIFWSIPPEIQFYGLFGVFWYAVHRGYLAVAAPAIILFAGATILFRPVFPGISLPSYVHIFFLGVALSVMVRRGVTALISPKLAAFIQAISITALLFASLRIWPDKAFIDSIGWQDNAVVYGDMGLALCFGAFLLASTVPNWFGQAIFANKLMRRIGRYSFSLYLLHEPVLAGTGYLTSGFMPGIAQVVIGIVLSLLVAAFSFHMFENPVQDALRTPIAKIAYLAIGKVMKVVRLVKSSSADQRREPTNDVDGSVATVVAANPPVGGA